MRECIGRIVEVNEKASVGRILEEGEHGRVRPFTFDTIKGYRGQPLRELTRYSKKGLARRAIVKFDLNESTNTIEGVRPLIWRSSF